MELARDALDVDDLVEAEEIVMGGNSLDMAGHTKPKKRKRAKKDPNAPKGALSAYICFCNAIRSKLKENDPTLSITEITRQSGIIWKGLSDEEKIPYQEEAKKDKERYQEEMKTYVKPPPDYRKKRESKPREPTPIFPRDFVTPKIIENEAEQVTILSWNVASLKSLCSPDKKHILDNLVASRNPHFLFMQETKIQDVQMPEVMNLLPNYNAYYHCSVERKGYAGTAVFIRKDVRSEIAPTMPGASVHPSPFVVQRISYDFEDFQDKKQKHFSGEGRAITVETDKFFVVGVDAPESNLDLSRLAYRVNEWDAFVPQYINDRGSKKPVIYCGDLKVAPTGLDLYNPDAKHIPKTQNLTPDERAAHQSLLENAQLYDAFRFYYPHARGQFTYWSTRMGNRQSNRGIRLDHFLCSRSMFPTIVFTPAVDNSMSTSMGGALAPGSVPVAPLFASYENIPDVGVFDSFILNHETGTASDHCPIGLVLKVCM